MFCERCQSSSNLMLCFDVRDSQDCILSTNLRHARYMIENTQYTKEEYEIKKKEILASQESIAAAKLRFEEIKASAVVKFAFQTKCVNTTGDYLFNCHSCRSMYDAENSKDCAYMADIEAAEDCRDGNNMYYKPEKCLDMMGVLQSSNSAFCSYVFYCHDVFYSNQLQSCEYCFGCIGLKKGSYRILNKQYSKEEYEKLKSLIIENMKKRGEYGDFLPPETSPFKYNETMAKDYFPDPRAEEIKTGTYGQENGKDIFACVDCKKNFKITPSELAFYERMGLALPRKDFECRMKDRIAKRNPRKLWHRACMCTKAHPHHQSQCTNEFETTYASDRNETIYCEPCYQAEVA